MCTIAIRTSDEYFSQNPPTKIRKKSRFCKLLKIFLQKNIFIAIKFAYIDIFLYFLLRFFQTLLLAIHLITDSRARCEDSACRYRIMIRIKKNSEIVIERGGVKSQQWRVLSTITYNYPNFSYLLMIKDNYQQFSR